MIAAAALVRTTPSVAQGPAPEVVAGGDHWRLETPRGAVHVWRPAGYRPTKAGTVVYVHGYETTADLTWEVNHLPEQFAASRRNAVFVVPEAPSSGSDPVRWMELKELLDTAARGAGIAFPRRPVVAVGHSGAYRTLIEWLESPRLEQVVLLDALYGPKSVRPFRKWIRPAGGRRRLIVVDAETEYGTKQLLRGFPHAVQLGEIPASKDALSPRERRARLLALRSSSGHNELVSEGRVIAPTLALTSLPALPD